jgi:hypothetical protein
MTRPIRLLDLLVWAAEAVLISLALLCLAEYFGVPFVREAGGWIV